MTQRLSSDVPEVLFIEESTFGSSPIVGAWLHPGNVLVFDPIKRHQYKRKTGIGHQKPTAYKSVKNYWDWRVEASVMAADASPVYNWESWLDMMVNKDGSGNPADQPNFFSLGGKVDLATDEFYHLEGCMMDRFEVGASIDDIVKMLASGPAQHGDYLTTDYVTGTATRTAAHDAAETTFGECDVWYDIAVPNVADTILDRLNSWLFRMTRRIEKRGSDATTPAYYRDFVCVAQTIQAELELDFDSRTEYEHFIDGTEIYVTFRIVTAAGGYQLACGPGVIIDGGNPVRELDLMNVKLTAEFEDLAVTVIT